MATFERTEIADALTALRRVVEQRSTIPILQHIRLTTNGDGRASLAATDLDMSAVASIGFTGEPISVAIPADRLRQITVADKNDGELSITRDGNRAVIKVGTSRFHLNALPVDDFPSWEERPYSNTTTISGAEFADLLNRCAPAMEVSGHRPFLRGIYLHEQDSDLVAVSTDGQTLISDRLAGLGNAIPAGIIVGDKTVRTLAALVSEVAEIVFESSPQAIRITAGNKAITSKLVDGTFPDYRRVVPKKSLRPAVVMREDLAAACKRAELIHRSITLAFTFNQISASTRDRDIGQHEETLAAEYSGDDLTITCNTRLLTNALNAVGGEKVMLSMTDPGSAILITAPEETNRYAVVMPMREHS